MVKKDLNTIGYKIKAVMDDGRVFMFHLIFTKKVACKKIINLRGAAITSDGYCVTRYFLVKTNCKKAAIIDR